VPGRDPFSTASTPTGTFWVDGKLLWTTMVSSTDSSIVHGDVMYVQNFHGPHALARRLLARPVGRADERWLRESRAHRSVFGWSEPQVPPGWHGMRSVAAFGAPTVVSIRP